MAVCDVDAEHAAAARERVGAAAVVAGDYRDVLGRDDVDVVFIATPDHWHTKIAVEALRAGKDVYCEKPLTLTIDEGKVLCRVVKETGRVFQVGTQQRSEFGGCFLTAVALAQAGRLGKIRNVTVGVGGGPEGGPFETMDPPPHLDWNMWLGQAPKVPYTPERCHLKFRGWYEYAGGLTDMGAHHIDIATWAIGMLDSGPVSIRSTATLPNIENGYNTATAFDVHATYPNGVELRLTQTRGGVLLEGDEGRIFVGRGVLDGKPVKDLRDHPLPEDSHLKLCKGKPPGSHVANFFACVRDRSEPISDVYSHHRILTTCHLANISIRLGRDLEWDPVAEQIVGDDEANGWQKRHQREGFEVEV